MQIVYLLTPVDWAVSADYLLPVFRRIRNFLRDVIRLPDYDQVARRQIARAILGDPNFAIAFVVDQHGKLLAHAVCEILEIDDKRVLFVSQCKNDAPGALDKLIAFGDNWGMTKGASLMRVETSDQWPEEVGQRVFGKYGFKLCARVMEREIKHG